MPEQRGADDASGGRSRRRFLAALGSAGVAGLAGCTTDAEQSTATAGSGEDTTTGGGAQGTTDSTGGGDDASISGTMTVFHAGSLSPPWSQVEKSFEEEFGVDVQREAKGSVGSTRKITDRGRTGDVLGVSDFRLIHDMMMGEYADWYGVFVTNAMAIAYTDESKYAREFTEGNWWNVLTRDDVNVAHADPAVDPNGYRSVMAMKLGAVEFQGERLYDQSTAQALRDNAKVTSGTETDLIGQLESGALDYAWEYASVGASHENLNTLMLQPHVNLAKATAEYAEHYAKAKVKAGGQTYTGAPIAYGITVPSVAENPAAGRQWVEYVTQGHGVDTMTQNGFQMVSPMVVPESTKSAVPSGVMKGATAQQTLGPLQL